MSRPVFLRDDYVILRPLLAEDASPEYLDWLNDPEVLRYRSSKAYPSTATDLEAYIASIPSRGDLVLAICEAEGGRHIGNIALNTILWTHKTAELSIMIGGRDTWGKGYGRRAIKLITAHAFRSMGLRRIWAESPNPAFNAVMKRLGWVKEGVKRSAFLVDGEYVDFECWGLLASEYDGRQK